MGDGGYYEGQFLDGEIDGNGFRFWADNHKKYTGWSKSIPETEAVIMSPRLSYQIEAL